MTLLQTGSGRMAIDHEHTEGINLFSAEGRREWIAEMLL